MCRRTQIPGLILVSAGIGFLICCVLGSSVFSILVGIGLMLAGILLLRTC